MSSGSTADGLFIFQDTIESAKRVIPIVLNLLENTPHFIVDLGGGVGSWSRVFKEFGVSQVLCIDDPRIALSDLKVDKDEFRGEDLSHRIPEPIKCDLAISLEFAEHVPGHLSSDIVRFLTKSAPIVLFSAAIPGQPSIYHINERPARFWKELFADQGYTQFDIVRPQIIHDRSILYCYRQNLFLYATDNWSKRFEVFKNGFSDIPMDFELVHERVLNEYRKQYEYRKQISRLGVKAWIKEFPRAIRRTLKRC